MTKKTSALSHIRALNDLRRCAAQSRASEESKVNPSKWDDAIAAAIIALKGGATPLLGPIMVIMDGGICQTVVSDDRAMIGLEYVTIDYDTDGSKIGDANVRYVSQRKGNGRLLAETIAGKIEKTEVKIIGPAVLAED